MPALADAGSRRDTVYVFFQDVGLVAYDHDGTERWRLPLGPFTNAYGMGASPIVVDDLVILVCDQSHGSFMLAVDRITGAARWRVERPEAKTGHSTPIVYRPRMRRPSCWCPDPSRWCLFPGWRETLVGQRPRVRDEGDPGHARRCRVHPRHEQQQFPR